MDSIAEKGIVCDDAPTGIHHTSTDIADSELVSRLPFNGSCETYGHVSNDNSRSNTSTLHVGDKSLASEQVTTVTNPGDDGSKTIYASSKKISTSYFLIHPTLG